MFFFIPHTYSINVGDSEIHIGSIIERKQNVILYDQTIEVKINTLEFLQTPDILDSILEAINDINDTLISKELVFSTSHDYSFNALSNATTVQLLHTLDLVNQKLTVARSWFLSSEPRNKRNAGAAVSTLLGIVGLGSSIASHVRVSNAWHNIQRNSEDIQEINWNTGLHRDKINEIISDLNSVQSALENTTHALSDMFQFLNLFITLTRVQSKVDYFIDYVKTNIRTLISVSKGNITPAIISINQLRSILDSVHILGFTPVFSNNFIKFYYTILNTVIDDVYIFVNIPVASSDVHYDHYMIHPFPTYFHDKLVTLNINVMHVLVSNVTTNYIATNDLKDCKDSPTVLVCPKRTYITFFDWEESCPLRLISNMSSQSCSFQEKDPDTITDPTILFTESKTYVLSLKPQLFEIGCGNRKERRKVDQEVFSVNRGCSIETTTWKASTFSKLLKTLHRVDFDFKRERFVSDSVDVTYVKKNLVTLPTYFSRPPQHFDVFIYIFTAFAIPLIFTCCYIIIRRRLRQLRCVKDTDVPENPVSPVVKNAPIEIPRQPFRLIFT